MNHSIRTLVLAVRHKAYNPQGAALVLTVLTSLLTTLQLRESVRQIVYGVVLLLLLSVYGRQRGLRQ